MENVLDKIAADFENEADGLKQQVVSLKSQIRDIQKSIVHKNFAILFEKYPGLTKLGWSQSDAQSYWYNNVTDLMVNGYSLCSDFSEEEKGSGLDKATRKTVRQDVDYILRQADFGQNIDNSESNGKDYWSYEDDLDNEDFLNELFGEKIVIVTKDGITTRDPK